MGNAVFITSATVECPHGSKVVAGGLSSNSKLTVNGKPVMTSADIAGATLDGTCIQKDTSHGQVQCMKVASISGTISGKLSVGSTAVATATLAGLTDGVPLNQVDGSAGQALLTAA